MLRGETEVLMSSLPLHPAIVHLPVALAVLLPALALGVWFAWKKGWLPGRAWWVVAALQGALVVGALAAINTGEREEERVEKVVNEAAIEAHEEAATLFTGAAVFVFALSLIPLFVKPDGLKRAVALGTAAGSVLVAGLAFNVGRQGGELVYRHGAASAYAGPASAQAVAEQDDD